MHLHSPYSEIGLNLLITLHKRHNTVAAVVHPKHLSLIFGELHSVYVRSLKYILIKPNFIFYIYFIALSYDKYKKYY